MQTLRWIAAGALLSLMASLPASAEPQSRQFGKHAKMTDIAGAVVTTGTSTWGARYIVVKDGATGLRIYVQTDAQACTPGKPFKATGHLTRAKADAYDATFHGHLPPDGQSCSR